MVTELFLILGLGLSLQSHDSFEPARSAIVKAQVAQSSMRAYKVVNRTTYPGTGETLSSTLVFVSPDRFHSVDHEGAATQIIRIGAQGWMKLRNDPWEKEPFDSISILRRLRAPTAIDDPKYQLMEAQALGVQEIQGHKTLAYRYTVQGRGETSRVQLWVSQETGLPKKFEEAFENSSGKQKVTWDVEYDSSLVVEPPVLPPPAADPRAQAVEGCRTLAAMPINEFI